MGTDRLDRREGFARQTLLEEDVTREIIGAYYDVYNALGYGFLESPYKRALEMALIDRGLRVEREFPIEIYFNGRQIGFHRLDMVVERRVVVEVKATEKLADGHKRQLLSYLTASNLEVGLLLHFGPTANFCRVIATRKRRDERSDPEKSA